MDKEKKLERIEVLEKRIEEYRKELADDKVELRELEIELDRARKYYDKKNEALESLVREKDHDSGNEKKDN